MHGGSSFSSAVLDQCVHYEAAQYACGHHTHSLTHTDAQAVPSLHFPEWFLMHTQKKEKKEKGQNTQTLGLSLPTTLSPFQHVFISVMSHTNTQRPLPDLDAPTQPLSSSFQSYAHSMQNTSAHTHFPASDDSGLSSQMLCIFFSTYTHRQTHTFENSISF